MKMEIPVITGNRDTSIDFEAVSPEQVTKAVTEYPVDRVKNSKKV